MSDMSGSGSSVYTGLERYRSPKSQMMDTINFPALSGRAATCRAAQVMDPLEIPAKVAYSRASRRAVAMASSLETRMTSSYT